MLCSIMINKYCLYLKKKNCVWIITHITALSCESNNRTTLSLLLLGTVVDSSWLQTIEALKPPVHCLSEISPITGKTGSNVLDCTWQLVVWLLKKKMLKLWIYFITCLVLLLHASREEGVDKFNAFKLSNEE